MKEEEEILAAAGGGRATRGHTSPSSEASATNCPYGGKAANGLGPPGLIRSFVAQQMDNAN